MTRERREASGPSGERAGGVSNAEPQHVILAGLGGRELEGVRAVLEDEGCVVVAVTDPLGALELAQENSYDLVVVDLDSVGVPGGELVGKLKSVAPQTMVMPLSSLGSAESAIEAMRAGAYDYFRKPLSLEELRHRVQRALENKRQGEMVRRRTLQLAFVNEISNAISASLDLRQVLQTAAAAVRALIDFDIAVAILRSASEDAVTVHPLTPEAEALWNGHEGGAMRGSVLAGAEDRTVPEVLDADEAGALPRELAILAREGYKSLIVLPLVSKGRMIGGFVLASRRPRAFSASDAEVLQHVEGHLASAVDNAQLYEQLKTLSSQLEETVRERSREVFEVKQYLENLVETAGDAIITVDHEGNVTSWNRSAEQILGYRKDKAIGRELTRLASGQGARDQLTAILVRALEGRTSSNVESTWVRKDGKEVVVSLTVSPISAGDEDAVGALVIGRDITERKKLQEELFHSEKLASIGQLAAGVAHQINNPLGAISGRIQMLLRLSEGMKHDFVLEQLGKMQADCDRIAETVNDLLGFARKTETVKQYTDVNLVLDETVEMVRQEVIARKIRIEQNYTPNLPPIIASENHLRQLFANLMTNAFDAMRGGGTLKLTTALRPATDEREGEMVEVVFEDEGTGIPEEDLPRIFEPFFTTKPAGEGTGLGLAVAKRIVDFHNGRIEVESKVGVGTKFTIRFPVE